MTETFIYIVSISQISLCIMFKKNKKQGNMTI